MKSRLAAGLLGVLSAGTLLVSAPAFAYTSPGSPTGYVNDFAHVLSVDTKQSLQSELTLFEASTTNEIAVAIVPSMNGDYIENYAVKLFEEWKIGKKDKDNGALLVLSLEEHSMRIEVGYGLEGALPDSLAQRILDDEMTPLLKAGDYDSAVSAGVHAIEAATKGEYVGHTDSNVKFPFKDSFALIAAAFVGLQWILAMLARSKSWWAGGILGLIAGVGIAYFFAIAFAFAAGLTALLTVIGLALDFVISQTYHSSTQSGIRPPWWAGGGGIGGSSGGGFGGFGGGSSGGGGASGRW